MFIENPKMSGISACFLFEMVVTKPSVLGILGGFIPSLPPGSLTVATGILGATIMPHNIYLHSGIVIPRRSNNEKQTFWNCLYALFDGILSLNFAFLINASILITAAAFHNRKDKPDSIETAYVLLEQIFGRASSVMFGIALLLSGQSSTITGTMAGSIVMEGFLQMKLRPWIRRIVTRTIAIVPATIVLIIVGDDGATQLLIWSQIILSMQLPFAMVPLIRITSHAHMGKFKNFILVQLLGWICVLLVGGLNIWLIIDIFIENGGLISLDLTVRTF
jgi:manganese transport protein